MTGRASAGALAVALLLAGWPAAARADPTDEEPAAARLDPDYAAGMRGTIFVS